MEIGLNTLGTALAYRQGESGTLTITMPIPQFLGASGIGRSKTYELINEGEIQSVLVGKRRLIIVQSYLDYLERQKQAEANGIGRIASPNPRAVANRNGSGSSLAKAGQKSRITSPAANEAAPARQRPARAQSPKSRRSRSRI
jgi:hypothetical protein